MRKKESNAVHSVLSHAHYITTSEQQWHNVFMGFSSLAFMSNLTVCQMQLMAIDLSHYSKSFAAQRLVNNLSENESEMTFFSDLVKRQMGNRTGKP